MKQLILLALLLVPSSLDCGREDKEEKKAAPTPHEIMCHARVIIVYNDDPEMHTVEIFQDPKQESRKHIRLKADQGGIPFSAPESTTPTILELVKYGTKRKIVLFNTGDEVKEFSISDLFS